MASAVAAAYDVHVTSVAYPERPELPGWIDATLSLVVGWFLSAVGIFLLYLAAALAGAMYQPYGSQAGDLNQWPYPDNGVWSLFANIAVISIGLVVTTVATSWWLRKRHPRVSDGRLALVLLFAGWIPLAAGGPKGGLFGFLAAVVLIRHWVGRYEDHLTRPKATAALVAVLGSVVLSYGLLHPLWTANVSPTIVAGKHRSVVVEVHNAARTGATIDRIGASAFGPVRPSRLHLAPGADGEIVLSVPSGCGTPMTLGIHLRYHVFGLALGETLPARVSLGSC